MQFNPKALLIGVAAAVMVWYAVENLHGVTADVVDALLTWGLWALIPNRLLDRSSPR